MSLPGPGRNQAAGKGKPFQKRQKEQDEDHVRVLATSSPTLKKPQAHHPLGFSLSVFSASSHRDGHNFSEGRF